MNSIVVCGAGGLGRGVMDLLERINEKNQEKWNLLGFIDDYQSEEVNGYKVIGSTEYLLNSKEKLSVVLAFGNPDVKKAVYNKLSNNKYLLFPNIVHPSVELSRFIKLGKGNIVSSGVSMSANIEIGNFNLIHYNCSIGHDVILQDYNSIYPLTSLSGYVSLESGIEIGANTTILPKIKIDDGNVIGAGSVVIRDIKEEGITVAGVPAKKI